ncbi:MAG: GNAT family N-acetyltransferase [Tunicatimonas sp.]
MIRLKLFEVDNWKYLRKWIANESELIQFAGPIFSFPVDRTQVENYLSNPDRTVFKIENSSQQAIGMAEISDEGERVAKLARILIGEESMRGKGIGTELVNQLADYGFNKLKKKKLILNVYAWNLRAIKCYEKAGFRRADRSPTVVTVGSEAWETVEMENVIAPSTSKSS